MVRKILEPLLEQACTNKIVRNGGPHTLHNGIVAHRELQPTNTKFVQKIPLGIGLKILGSILNNFVLLLFERFFWNSCLI